MPEIRSPVRGPGIPEQEFEAVSRIMEKVTMFEDSVGRDFRDRCMRFYRQYRGFRQFRDVWTKAGPNDRDELLHGAKQTWGAHLHIPLSFRTIESIVPKAIAQAPKMLILPRDEQWRKNLEAIRLLIDRQQQQIGIDLPFQAVMRAGRIYGLGIGKCYWRKEIRSRRRVQRKMFAPGFKVGTLQAEVTFDDPVFEDVDPFDFMWDPYGSDLDTCEWVVHRVWMSTEAVLQRLSEGVWNTESAATLDEDQVRTLGGGGGQQYDEIWRDRLEVSGFRSWTKMGRGEQPHELLEWHDGERVLTILDRQVLVQEAENPCVGYVPFQIYRPTPINKQFVGIGDLEPLEHLQRELDTLRSQRRDSATIALCASYVFDDQMIDEDDLVFGPGTAIRASGNPQQALFPLPVKEIPGSGYQEESVIRQDIEAVSGIADALDPRTGASTSTATEAQLVQASLGARITLSARRFETEVVEMAARAFLMLDQRMITENRPALQVPEEGVSEDEAWETGAWHQYPIGPGELMGEYEIQVEGGSMAARNVPQDRADAQLLMNLFGHSWYINPAKPLERALELCGIKHPKAWMKAQEPPIPRQALAFLELAGVDPNLIEQAVMKARTTSSPQEGPGPDMVTAMLGGAAAAPGVGTASANGAGAAAGAGPAPR